jgi:hypothetical protein
MRLAREFTEISGPHTIGQRPFRRVLLLFRE